MQDSSLKRNLILPMTSALCSCHQKPKTSIEHSLMMNSIKNSPKSFKDLNPLNKMLIFLMALYRTAGSLFLGGSCRFEPSCSAYAVEALKVHSSGHAIKLILIRLSKCRPWGPSGYDPVPPAVDATK